MKLRDEDALGYHAAAPAGKIAIRATKPCLTQRDLSLAYTPGVAVPCLAIERESTPRKETSSRSLPMEPPCWV
jgi:malate dehydrogenase (oxaloacetate-decarboxylating)(NADP+)